VRPPPEALAAFGVAVAPEPLAGGRGTSWRAGNLVLKPLDATVAEIEWLGTLFDSLRPDGVRIPRLRGLHGGWCAWDLLEGEHRDGRWADVIAAGERFHAALLGVPRPSFLDSRASVWAIGDRVAWGELPAAEYRHVKHLARLADALRPVDESASQLVHGDLTGNVLFADGLPPAVIDFSPYWRPPAFATAVVVGDALLWEGADESLLDAVAHVEDFPQLLLRALIFRAVADALVRGGAPHRPDDRDCFLGPVELACSRAGG
jgi:uncharacterized protein (TIGR02569 family)